MTKTTSCHQVKSEKVLLSGIVLSGLFVAVIWFFGDHLKAIAHPPDQGALWYFWILEHPNRITRGVVWSLYLLHQLILGGLIYYAQNFVKEYTDKLHGVNLLALAVNALFILAHFFQTHIFYDGLAQDVSNWSSQNSVILLLVMVLIIENQRRGLFFGRPAPLKQEVVQVIRKYHGYVFSWACTYTFWFHPMEATYGHLLGFFYMFMLLLQGSLFLTRAHLNKYWTMALEVLVLIHAATVAFYQGNNLWKMFAFGFATLFIVTQMHGLGLSRRTKILLIAVYLGCIILAFSGTNLLRLELILRLPLVEYLCVVIVAGPTCILLWVRLTLTTHMTVSDHV